MVKSPLPEVSVSNSNTEYNLVLDLDETIIHTTHIKSSELIYHVDNPYYLAEFDSGPETKGVIYYRPGLVEFLKYCKLYFSIYIYTMANKSYTDIVLSRLFDICDDDEIIKGVYCKDDFNLDYKDLGKTNLDIKNTIIIDDRPNVWRNLNNVITISLYKGIEDDLHHMDNELMTILNYLEDIINAQLTKRYFSLLNQLVYWKKTNDYWHLLDDLLVD
jgi:TFIIF-interacting CTD phosphatase-like protein